MLVKRFEPVTRCAHSFWLGDQNHWANRIVKSSVFPICYLHRNIVMNIKQHITREDF